MKEHRKRSRVFEGAVALLYGSFLAFLLVSSLWQGLSHYYSVQAFRTGSEADIAASFRYGPDNPTASKTEALVHLRNKNYPEAAAAFERALALREIDFLLWSHLGYVRQQLGEPDGAASAFERSIKLAPNYSQPRYYMGMLLLDADRDEEAFKYLSDAARYDASLYPAIQRLARRNFKDAKAIESAVRPVSADAKRSVARYLIKYHYMTDSIRSFLLSDELTISQKNEFVKYLLHKNQFQLARDVWLSRQGQDASAADLPIYDGGFERIAESDASGLGWQIDQTISSTAVARDKDNVHSGDSSLNVRFAGNVELRRPVISQIAFVEPVRRYTLTFFVRSTEIITAGPPAIVISDLNTNEIIARSAPIPDTDGKWIQLNIDFTTKDAPVVLISLQRPTCNASPCPIFGDLSLDNFSLANN